MIAEPSLSERAKCLYRDQLQADLELRHRNRFVAIEPSSGDFFLGNTFVEAALDAKKAHPDRESFVIRIGHDAAFHIGATVS